jgi:hypothetical protein
VVLKITPLGQEFIKKTSTYKPDYLPSGLNSPIDPQKDLAKFG